MTSLIDSIGNYLATQSFGVLGTDLFLTDSPNKPDKLTALRVYMGGSGFDIMGETTRGEEYRIQIYTRAITDNEAWELNRTAYKSLLSVSNRILDGNRILAITSVSAPAILGQDDAGRWEAFSNIEIQTSE